MSTPTHHDITPADLKRQYLLSYNAISAALWFGVLGRVVMFGLHSGLQSGEVYEQSERFTRLSQSLALLEVVHSAVGFVRAPLFTTVTQVASRLLLVWGIAYNFPQTTKHSPAYSSMLIAWSVTELIRYSYFVFLLGGKGVPKLWTWLRYNTFFVLYPLGVASECWLIYRAIPPASKLDERFGYGLWAILATYVPGFYTLFTHMLRQRSKVLRAAKAEKGKKAQ
ncbi:PTPLA-domain-containing protein [Byssothecium circinans]|uniref:Very-long-chain (3R)-3-hydroxyacyl-CoA dehydratase n=1 Tax=Byssothecium circinans TaxID=147558 RepID=A0A6A5U4B4_9PLEO|nr:PTPLA-domain-containing protein [Byssothecium circinans]